MTLLLTCVVTAQADWMRAKVITPRLSTIAYDANRDRIVSFSGSESGRPGETWEFDGSHWALRPVVSGPGYSPSSKVTYAPSLGGVVLLQGAPATTWLWDGVRWESISGALPERLGHAVAYDAARGVIVLFGGRDPATHTSLADTWELGPLGWVQRAPSSAPLPRSDAGMAYDIVRQRIVLFGGQDNNGSLLGDTWEWDGRNWSAVNPATAPFDRSAPAMCFDSRRSRIVLYGGTAQSALSDTWEYDGVAWNQVDAAAPPGALWAPALTFDSSRQRVVLVGEPGDTWQWDAQGWRKLLAVPPSRTGTVLAERAGSGRVVMFGGLTPGPTDDTWEWDGTQWLEQPAAIRPSPRYAHAAASSVAGRVVMFGGLGLGWMDDTWTWDGTTWQRHAGPAPNPRSEHAMAYDSARQRVVMFGGRDATSVFGDTWEWNGSTWSQLTPTVAPSARQSHAMAYDSRRQRVVLFGGTDGTATFGDTWEWDGSTWNQRAAPGPAPRRGHAMVYSEERQAVVMVGALPLTAEVETWEWDGVRWFEPATRTQLSRDPYQQAAYDSARRRVLMVHGSDYWSYGNLTPSLVSSFGFSCQGEASLTLAAGSSHVGNTQFRIDMLQGSASMPGVLALSPFRQSQVIGNCVLYVANPLVTTPMTTNAAGFASLLLPIAASPALRGVILNAQGFVLATYGTTTLLSFTPGLRIVIGD